MKCARLAGICGIVASFALAASALAAPPLPGEVVISQIWGGVTSTGLSGAPKADYIELFNRTSATQDLTGCSIAVTAAVGNTAWFQHNFPNGASIPGFSYYLIRVGPDGTQAGSLALPAEDTAFNGSPSASSNTNLGTASGKAVLRDVTTLIGTNACPTIDSHIIDLIAWGSTASTCREGSGQPGNASTSSPFNTPTRLAGGCTDTNQNGSDWTLSPPNPHNVAFGSIGGCATGACCNNSTGNCTSTTQGLCTGGGGTYRTDGSTCPPTPACATGACCNSTTGACTITGPAGCSAGVYHSAEACPNAACPAAGACCSGTSGSTCTAPLTTAGCTALAGVNPSFYLGDNSTCTATPCATGACCFASSKSCCNLYSQLCSSQGGVASAPGVTCTTTTPVNCAPGPANDLCANAITLTLGNPVTGNNINATTTGDGLNTPCSTTKASRGVWFKFTPIATSVYEISTCGSSWDNVLGVFTLGTGGCADVSTWTYIACADDGCTSGPTLFCSTAGVTTSAYIKDIQLTAGVEYHIILASDSTTAAGNYTIVVNNLGAITVGACCNQVNGLCTIQSSAACSASAPTATGATPVYNGDGSSCAGGFCVSVGACCSASGVCTIRRSASCTSGYQGDGSLCSPDPCINGACCSSAGACTITFPPPQGCTTAGSTYQGDFTVCSPMPCPPAGSCCNTCTYACLTRVQDQCFIPDVWTNGGTCTAPSTCIAGAPPANDLPCNAIALTLGSSVSSQLATATSTGDGPASSCDTTATKGVWYSFHAMTSGYYSVSTCGSTFASLVTVLSGSCSDPDNMTMIACDDDTCPGSEAAPCGSGTGNASAAVINFVYLNAGADYYVRVQVDGTGTGGTFPIVVNSTVGGACCNATTGACTVTSPTGCTVGAYQGDGTACAAVACLTIAMTTPAQCGATVGTSLSAVLTIANMGPANASSVVASVRVPGVFGFTSSVPAGSLASGVLTANLGAIAALSSATLTLNGTATSGTPGSFAVSAASTQTPGPIVFNPLDASSAANLAMRVFVVPTAPAPISVLLSSHPSAPSRVLPANGSFPGANIGPYTAEGFSKAFLSPDGSHYVVSVDTDLAATQDRVLLTGTTHPFTVIVGAQEGVTMLDLGDTVGEFDYGMGVNNSGQYVWSATATGGSVTTAIDEVIVRGSGTTQTVIVREGDAAPAIGAGVTYSGANSALGIRPNGNVAFFATLAGTGGGTGDDTAIFDASGAAVLAQESVTVPTGSADAIKTFTIISSSDVGEGSLVRGPTDWLCNAFLNSAASNDDSVIVNGAVVLREGDTITGLANPISTIVHSDFAGAASWIAYGSSTVDAGADWVIRNGTLVAKTGNPIHTGAAEHWYDGFYGPTFFAAVTNSVGDYVVAGTVDNDPVSNAVWVANNHHIVMRENNPIDIDGNGVFDEDVYISTYRDDRCFLADDGWLYFHTHLRNAAAACTTGLADSAHMWARINIHTGACCNGSICTIAPASECTGPNRSYAGDTVSCNAPGNNTTPCCKADFNHMGGIAVNDIFSFLSAWFAHDPSADINGGGIAVNDIFSFLTAWFAGGC